ncbi:flagellin lysine-N-methylase [Paraburkholderia hayleyella]|uniref:flagellin lysine-N-methylase n=1 Tax=Paraburkholderia hayleyella TaxID=2152889 RepID=UPI001FE99A3F|nr:flagellin lysine-N-methylase [Paraburkholderia hayleyella]
MLVPRYQTRFSCAGPECPDTCCAGWRITIDKATFQRYKASHHSEMKPLFKLHVQRNRHAQKDEDYGLIRLDAAERSCGLQDASGLCLVHARLGEDALSNTCHTYPRHTCKFAGQYEQILTLSCPQAARLALLDDDAFEFERVDVTARAGTLMTHRPLSGLNDDMMFAARTWAVQLLRTRQLPIVERLVVLGLLCDQIETLLQDGQFHLMPDLLEQMTQVVESGAILESLANLPCNEALQVQLFARFLCNPGAPFRSEYQQRIFEQVAMGLGADQQGQAETRLVEARYREGRARLAQSPDLEAVLERYLVNETLRERFPWGEGSPLRHYRQCMVRFGVVRVMLAGYANALERTMLAEDAVEVIQVFCRAFQHNTSFATHIESILKQCEWESLHQWFAVLK